MDKFTLLNFGNELILIFVWFWSLKEKRALDERPNFLSRISSHVFSIENIDRHTAVWTSRKQKNHLTKKEIGKLL
jgi:hypothetical protein